MSGNGVLGFDMSKPDFTNKEGVKWWAVKDINDRAAAKDANGISLPQVKGWLTELPNGERSFVLVLDGKGVLADDKTLEGIATKLDMLKLGRASAKLGKTE